MVQSFLVAALLVALVAWVGGIYYRGLRDRGDRAEAGRDAERAEIAREFDLPPAPPAAQFETPAAMARADDWRKRFHDPAIALKNRYYEFLGRCGVLLAFIFILMALNVTVLQSVNWLNPFFAAIDVLGALYVVVHWWRSKIVNQDWILTRIHSELMRQWLQMVFAFGWSEERVAAGYEDAARRIEKQVLTPESKIKQRAGFGLTSEQLEARIESYWASLARGLIDGRPDQPAPDWRDRLLTYLHSRGVGQLRWFRMRSRQLEASGKRRAMVTSGLFVFTLALAVVNVVVVANSSADSASPASNVLNLLLLVTTAVSAALTYWYVNRNERSIGYRYATQRRQIGAWIGDVKAALDEGEAAPIYDDVIILEALITSELIDWVHVT